MSKLLIQNGKLLRGAGGKLLTTASAAAMRECCCQSGPCCQSFTISGAFGAWLMELQSGEEEYCAWQGGPDEGHYALASTAGGTTSYMSILWWVGVEYYTWEGRICRNGGAVVALCDNVARHSEWDPPVTLNCADYPVTISGGASCNWPDCQ